VRASYRSTGPCHLLSAPAAFTTPRRPRSRCDGLSQFNEDTGRPSCTLPENNLMQKPDSTCRQGWDTPCRIASQAFTAPRPKIARPLSHGGRWCAVQYGRFLLRDAMLYSSVHLSVCLCVCLSHSGIAFKRLNVGSRK